MVLNGLAHMSATWMAMPERLALASQDDWSSGLLEQVFQVGQAEDESLPRPSLTISTISILSHSNNSLRPAQIQEWGN